MLLSVSSRVYRKLFSADATPLDSYDEEAYVVLMPMHFLVTDFLRKVL